VTVRKHNSEHDLALFRPNWKGEGTLEFQGGRSFSWKHLDFWHSEWAFLDQTGQKLIYFKPVSQLLKTETSVHVDPQAVKLEEFQLLVLTGWYLLVLMADDAAAASVAAFSAMG